jgi:copper(I)-binding protein
MRKTGSMTSKLVRLAVACTLLATAKAASAEDFKAGDLVISHPWSRATPAGAQVGAGYLVIENRGTITDRFLGGSVEVATGFELHDVVLEGGVMKMRQLTGIDLPPGSSVEAKPGGRHIMFVGLRHPLAAGEKVRGALQFERAGKIAVEFEVIAMGAPPPGGRGD